MNPRAMQGYHMWRRFLVVIPAERSESRDPSTPCGALSWCRGFLDPGSAAHRPRVALRAPEGKLVPGPRYGADPGMLRCARD